MPLQHASSHKNGQRCCPFELAYHSGKNYLLQCSTAIGVAVMQPFLGVSSLNFRPLFSGLFSFLGSPVLAEPLCSLQVEHPNRHAVCHQSMIPRLLGQPLALSLADEGPGILPKVTLREPSSATHEKLRAPVT